MSRKRKLQDMMCLAAGQGAAAIGTLLGVTLLTNLLPPETFGTVSLGLSTVALLIAALSTPFTQAVMHLYPAYLQQQRLPQLRVGLRLATSKMTGWIVLSAAAVIVTYLIVDRDQLPLVLLLMLLLAADVRRSLQTSVLNAAKRHRRYAFWIATDAWARPLAAAAAVMIAGQSAAIVIGAYLVASWTMTALLSVPLWGARAAGAVESADQVAARMWQYALPLIPVGVISWSNNLSDRFIIGGMLGVDAAGVYAATFGLSSAPFIMLTTVLEQAFRPEYQNAVTAGEYERANRQLTAWIVVTIVAAAIGVLAFLLWREQVALLLLGPQYRSALDLMPWIAAGYAVRAVAYVLDRVAYAFGRTRRVLASQLCAAVATMTVTPCAVYLMGLQGAAVAVPVCFGVYLCAAIINAGRTRHESPASASLYERTTVPSP